MAILRKALARERLEYEGETYTLPLPDGPGKALKLMIAPVQERIPIYIAAIGPKNTQLTGEIADGWMPTFFSPEHVGEFRELLEEGAARAGRQTIDELRHRAERERLRSTTTSTARATRCGPLLALYVGGMGSRKKNFYNALVRRYGFEDAAKEVQDLYLDGKKDEAAAALPAELIDKTALVRAASTGSRSGSSVYREAGVGTLITHADRLRPGGAQARCSASSRSWSELARAPPLPARRVRRPRPRVPGDRARPGAGARAATRSALQTWDKWQEQVEREGMRFAPAPEYKVFPTRERAAEALPGGGAGGARDAAADRGVRPGRGGGGHPHGRGRRWPPSCEGRPWATLVPHVLPTPEPGLPPYSIGARLPRTPLGARAVAPLDPLAERRAESRVASELNGARARRRAAAARSHARRDLATSWRWSRRSRSSSTRVGVASRGCA